MQVQSSRTTVEIENWLVSYLAELLQVDTGEIDTTIPFDDYGLDSATAIGLTGDLKQWLAIELDPTLIYDYPSIESLVQHISRKINADKR